MKSLKKLLVSALASSILCPSMSGVIAAQGGYRSKSVGLSSSRGSKIALEVGIPGLAMIGIAFGLARKKASSSVPREKVVQTIIADVNSEIMNRKKAIEHVKKDLFSKYDFVKKLGSGKQGSVDLYKDRGTKKYVAIKKASKNDLSTCNSEKLVYKSKEVLAMCPYFSKPIEYFEDNNYFYFVYEYIDGFGVFDQNKLKEYVEHLGNNVDIFMCKIALQFMIAFKHLYENKLSYGDLRSGNIILIDDKISDVPVIKIIDYGYFGSGNNKINERGWDLLSDLLDEICDTVLRSLGLDDENEIFETPNTLQFIRRLKGSFINWNRNPYYYNMRKKWKEENLEFKTYDEAIDFLQQVISNSEV